MSDNQESPKEQTPIAGELASGILQIMNTALKMGANITKGAAEITSAGDSVAPPRSTQDPINSMLHYGAATVSNIIRLVLPISKTTDSHGQPHNTTQSPQSNSVAKQQNIPTVRQGSTLRIPLMIENPHNDPYVDIAFKCLSIVTDTLADGIALGLENVRLEPKTLTVLPGDFEKLTVFIDIPENVAIGKYEVIVGQEIGDYEFEIPVHVIERIT